MAKPVRDIDALIDRRGDCWLWKDYVNRDGYGLYCANDRTYMAHRFIYARDIGEIPPGMVVMHICDVPACCRPSHLRLGTNAENTYDKVAKGRQAVGEQTGTAKLTEAQVREIRERYKFRKITHQMLADEYGVCENLVLKVLHRRLWKHVS